MHKSISIHNISQKDFNNVAINGESVGMIKSGEQTNFVKVRLPFAYAFTKMTIDDTYIKGQSLNFGSDSLIHKMEVIDLEKGLLDIEIVKN